MFNLSGSEIVVILLLALVVLGPEKLPDAIRRAGRTYSELKKMSSSFQSEMRSVLDEPMKEMRETADLLRQSADFTDGELRSTTSPPRLTAPTTAPTDTAASTTEPVMTDSNLAAPEPTATEPTTAERSDAAGPDGASDPNANGHGRDLSGDHAPDGSAPAASDRPPASTPSADEDPEQALINRTLSGDQ